MDNFKTFYEDWFDKYFSPTTIPEFKIPIEHTLKIKQITEAPPLNYKWVSDDDGKLHKYLKLIFDKQVTDVVELARVSLDAIGVINAMNLIISANIYRGLYLNIGYLDIDSTLPIYMRDDYYKSFIKEITKIDSLYYMINSLQPKTNIKIDLNSDTKIFETINNALKAHIKTLKILKNCPRTLAGALRYVKSAGWLNETEMLELRIRLRDEINPHEIKNETMINLL